MRIINQPGPPDWPALLTRPYLAAGDVLEKVKEIIAEVRKRGDDALRDFSKKFDGVDTMNFLVSQQETEEAISHIAPELKNAIRTAYENIKKFHAAQVVNEERVETMPGVVCWRKAVAIEKVGLYIPGGTAPLFSTVLMLGIPAMLAGCREIILCTPPGKNGNIHPAILYTARLAGVTKIFKTGGAQAIAAMALGTGTIPAVHKIFGPGNQYVTAAKQEVQLMGVAIDMPAGPSEVCVLADSSANPSYVAADLLSQAEHGTDSQVILVATDESIVKMVQEELHKQLALLPRKSMAEKALANSKAFIIGDIKEAIDLVNAYAPEHLIICCEEGESIAEKVINAGSVFIGNYAPESAGDYASGTNHTLPTNGFARTYSGVSMDSFVKKITFQKLSAEGLGKIASAVITMAEAEGLHGHAQAVRIRQTTAL